MPAGDSRHEREGAPGVQSPILWAALACILPTLVVWPFVDHPPAVLFLKEYVFQLLASVALLHFCIFRVRVRFSLDATHVLLAGFAATLWLSALTSGRRVESVQQALLWMPGLLLVFLLLHWVRAQPGTMRIWLRMHLLLLLPATFFLLQSAASLLHDAWDVDLLGLQALEFSSTSDAASGTYVNRNQIATLFLFLWPATAALWKERAGSWLHRMRWPALGISLLALATTRTEAAWIAAFVAGLYLAWQGGILPSMGKGMRRSCALAAVGTVALIATAVLLLAVAGPSVSVALPRSPSIVERAALWRIAWLGVQSNPLGYGPGDFSPVVLDHQSEVLGQGGYEGVQYLSIQAHNDFLELAATIGVAGAGLLLLLLLQAIGPFRSIGTGEGSVSHDLYLKAALIGFVVHGLFHYPLALSGVRGLALGVLGLLLGIRADPSGNPGRSSLPLLIVVLFVCVPANVIAYQGVQAAAQLNHGHRAVRHGNLEEAESHFRRATQSRPHWAHAWGNLGTALAAKGDRHGASEAFRRSLALSQRRDPRVLSNHAALQAQQGRIAAAASDYEAALDSNPVYLPAILGLAKVYELESRLSDARALYLRALELDPEETLAREGVARTGTGPGQGLPSPSD